MFFTSAENLAGLNTLSKEDQVLAGNEKFPPSHIIFSQDMLRKELPKMKRKVEASKDEPDAKKMKVDPAEEKQKEEMKKQNKKFVTEDVFGLNTGLILLLPGCSTTET